MRAFSKAVTGAGITVVAIIGPGTRAASGDAPSQAGWWWQANPGGAPEAAVPPDVPPDGLLIEGSSSSTSDTSNSRPTAYGALRFSDIPDGATIGKLTLSIGSVATTPNTTLQICPLAKPDFESEHGGPLSNAPSFDCTTNETAAPSSSGDTYEFNNAASMIADGTLAIAILPTSPADRVVLSAPDHNSLSLTPNVNNGTSSGTDTLTLDGTTSGGFITPGPIAVPSAATPPPNNDTPAPNQSSAPSAPVNGAYRNQYAASIPSSGGDRGAKPVVVAFLIGAALVGANVWSAAGRAAVRAVTETHS